MKKQIPAVIILALTAVLCAQETKPARQGGIAASAPASASQPVPGVAEQQKARRAVLDFVKNEKSDTPAEKRDIVRKLIESANSTVDPARRYVLLSTAIDRSREIEASDLIVQAWSDLRKWFETGNQELLNAARAARFNVSALTQALTALEKNPVDANANTVVGTCYAFYLRDWENALPLLDKSGNPEIKAAAKAELEKPADAAKMKDLADSWLAVGGKQGEIARDAIQAHALEILKKALELSDPVAKGPIEKTIDSLLKVLLPEQQYLLLGTWHVSIGKETVDWTFSDDGTVTSMHHGPPGKGKWTAEGNKIRIKWSDGTEWETINLPLNSGRTTGESWNGKKVVATR